MSDTPVPWVGLAALIAMFVLPFLPDWLFEGSRTTKHWPRRHICGRCGAPWVEGHSCVPVDLVVALPSPGGELRRVEPTATILGRSSGTERSPSKLGESE